MNRTPKTALVALVAALVVASVGTTHTARAEPTQPESSAAAPPPIMSAFSPNAGTKGTTVTITGKNLARTQQVRFYGAPALMRSATETAVTFVVPDLTPGTYPVTIVSGDAVASKPGFVVPVAPQAGLELASTMKNAGAGATETATALVQRSLVSGGGQGIDALNRAGFSAAEQATAARDVFGKSVTGTAMLLNGVGHSAVVNVSALRSVFTATAEDATVACGGAGITVETTASALKTVYGLSPARAAAVLRKGPWTSISVAGALKLSYKQSARDVAISLKEARYSEKETYDALVVTFSLTRRQALDVMLSAGFTAASLLGAV